MTAILATLIAPPLTASGKGRGPERLTNAFLAAVRAVLWVLLSLLLLRGYHSQAFNMFVWAGLCSLLTLAPPAIRCLREHSPERNYLILGTLFTVLVPAPMRAAIAMGLLIIAAAWSFAATVRDMRVVSGLPQAAHDAVTGLLDGLPALRPAPPMMMAATGMERGVFHVEHRPRGAQGFSQQRDQGGDDEDGDGDHANQTGLRDGALVAGPKVHHGWNFKACQAGRWRP